MKQIGRNTLLSLLALLLVVGTVGQSVSAAPMTKEEEVEELAADLEFLMEEAAIYDAEGSVIGFDFEKLEAEFGKVKELDMLEKEINSASRKGNSPMMAASIQPLAAKKTWKGCMIGALKDHFGVAIIEVAMTGGLWAYLEKKAYKEAAKLLIKIGVGGNAIGMVAFLTYYSAKCLEGVGPWASKTVESDHSILNRHVYTIV
ncbi:hypothetical protein [Rossellomorea aquimaris]|jgi:hypothetical protein|uniref:Uncharacterized protein n=1 Tax=Rossellomorea aquimaris TaxID=189382 RepID=A0A5D4U333_9BACI|nr:hypothetical protein [Rossellomorea aquimaris]TYS81744.1 hypothetical protein FZD05_02725 [Rossellomorea aquimaris]TYS88368.1 hypothetical protein FZC85_02725 [Rossellomorea aquimaris]